MSGTQAASSAAEIQGALWGTDARAWAEQEDRQLPIYEAVADAAGVMEGIRLLDVGCGSGAFLQLAADRGAAVSGLDASEPLVAIARERIPGADVRVGDIEQLPWEDATFDLVAGFNSFQFAGDVIRAMREAARVARPGGRVVIQVWGRPERCELGALLGAVGPLLPGPLPGPPGGGNYRDPGVLESIATAVGLQPRTTGDVVTAFEYAEEETMVRTTTSAGMVVLAKQTAGEEVVREAVLGAMAPFRGPDGSYRVENEWHWLIAEKPLALA
jgi:SAM-dependent methyltransferase